MATKEDIDFLVKRGLGFPVHPFELGDSIGLDVAMDVISYVHKQLDEPYYTSVHLGRTRPGLQARTKKAQYSTIIKWASGPRLQASART